MQKLLILLSALMVLLSGCSTEKTIVGKEGKQMVEEFYKDLMDADCFTMESYRDGTLSSVFTKDGDKMYVNSVEAGYDYYLFVQDGKKYLISDDRTLFEDESMYDLSLQTLNTTLRMNALAYYEGDDDSVTCKATNKNDSELTLNVTAANGNSSESFTSTGTKENGKVSKIVSEFKNGDSSMNMEYRFVYDQHVELPEYNAPKTYNDLPHVESPYGTFGEIADSLREGGTVDYTFIENEIFVIGEKDGRHYQFSSTIEPDILEKYNSLDVADENYADQVNELLHDVQIDDCVDFTDEILPQEELDAYTGKTIQSFIDDGFEISGYAFWEDGSMILVQKDLLTYRVDVKVPDGFDVEAGHEYDELNDFEILGTEFDSVEYAALPMR